MDVQSILHQAATTGYELDVGSVKFTLDLMAALSPASAKADDSVFDQDPKKPVTLDVAFFKSKLGKEFETISDVAPRDQTKMGGLSGTFQFFDITLESGKQIPMVLKRGAASDFRANMGVAREALFYKHLGQQFSDTITFKSYCAEGDMETGAVFLLLECANNAVPAGTFFGPGNPNNWGVAGQLEALCQGNPAAEVVTEKAFAAYASLHTASWNDESLMRHKWLRATSWYQGEGEASFTASLNYARGSWVACKKAIADGTSAVRFDPHLIACLDASFAKTSWGAYARALRTRPFSLVHGDCHPHNVLWCEQRSARAHLRLIDFEMVGVGSPAQELGQWTISHMTPALRRASERRLVSGYHRRVVESLRTRGKEAEAEAFTLEKCWAEYVAGGAGRWIWFVPVLATLMGAKMGQFFQNQLSEFLRDHVTDPETAPMPRL